MRKLVGFVLSLMVVIPAFPAHAAPGAYGTAEQVAEADWLVMTGRDSAVWYFAMATRGADPLSGIYTAGYAGKGDCEVDRGRNFTSISCSGSAKGKELAPDGFEFDPTLSSARMELQQGGFTHEVKWTGRGNAPTSGGQVAGNDHGVQAFAGLGRDAGAAGRMFGKKMPDHSKGGFAKPGSIETFALLGEGAFVLVLTDGDRSIRVRNGVATFRATFRIPN